MYKKNYYDKSLGFSEFAPFMQTRLYGDHSGIDYIHPNLKRTKIKNLFDGILINARKGKYFGLKVELKHNPVFFKGVNDIFYTSYCHLHTIKDLIKKKSKCDKAGDRLINSGETVGFMGNSGISKTFQNGNYRDLTSDEIENVNEWRGVHLHLWCYQMAKENEKTPLFLEMKRLNLIESNDYFYQWDRLIYKIDVLIKYYEILKAKENGCD